jgi:hypothetical protein
MGAVELLCYRTVATPGPRPRTNIGEEILDISPGGARVRVSEPMKQGDGLALELKDRASGESVRARGEVRWCASRVTEIGETHFVGVQFREVYTPVGHREKFTVGPVTAGAAQGARVLEKRGAPRFAVEDYVVTCFRQGALASAGLRRNLARRVADLSARGARLAVTEDLEPGAVLRLTLYVNPIAGTLESPAEVRWCRRVKEGGALDTYAGVQFLDFTDEKRKTVEFMRRWFGGKKP